MTYWIFSAAALACALMGGIFFAFSSFIMPALGRIPAEEAIRAMQRINIDVFHWTFMAAFFGTPILCVVAAAYGWARAGWTGEIHDLDQAAGAAGAPGLAALPRRARDDHGLITTRPQAAAASSMGS